jgi:hypothetical protein
MQRDRKTLLIGAGVALCGIVAGVLLYAGIRRSGTARALPAAELLSTLPAGAPTLIYLDLAAVRASSFYQGRPDRGPIVIPDRDYADFVQSTGFDFEKDLDRVVIASWPAGFAAGVPDKNRQKTVAVAEGRFNRAKIRDYAARKGKVDRQQGREVFLFPASDRANWNSLSFLDDHRVALVEGPSIAPLFESRAENPATDPVRERAARVDGAAMFAISRVPQVPDHLPGPGGAQSTQLASLARSLQWVTLAARPEGDNLRVSLEGECNNGEDARQLQSTLEALRLFGRAALESPKTRQSVDPATYSVLQTTLANAEITESGERVRILVELMPDILKLGAASKPK